MLFNVLTLDVLKKLAGNSYFQRGLDYFNQGQVDALFLFDDKVTVRVYESEEYKVEIWTEGNTLRRLSYKNF